MNFNGVKNMKVVSSKSLTALATAALVAFPTIASAAGHSKNLQQDDFVGISFWFISMALVAATAFFFIETQRVSNKWKTSLTV